ncbi:MAG: AMP phosphorylase [Thermoproteota archaeon]|nr:MAG: AMP phosphorylase [Candidatus Korarchaeota archaeon]
MELRTKVVNIRLDEPRAVINREDADRLGLIAGDRVKINYRGSALAAPLSISDFAEKGSIVIFLDLAERLGVKEGEIVDVTRSDVQHSVDLIRRKMNGAKLSKREIEEIVLDIYSGSLSNVELAAFILSLEFRGMDLEEIEYLTRAMAEIGTVLDFGSKNVVDKHSMGGVPGNSKDALIIVPIVASAGLLMPKTSTRAIMSPSGTVDTMEVLAPVDLRAEEIVEITKRVGGVITWAHAANISPVDAILIERVEYPLRVDPEPLIYASILSKKYAAGIRKLVVDIPVGEEAKVEDMRDARRIAKNIVELAERLDITAEAAISYGGQPIGRCIGPALEAREALEILSSGGKGSGSIVEKSLSIAGMLLEMGGVAARGKGYQMALSILESGKAYEKFREIVEAQGGDPSIKPEDVDLGNHKEVINSRSAGYVTKVSNKAVSMIARAAGAPMDKKAGVKLYAKRGDRVEVGDPIMEVFSSSSARLSEAVKLAQSLDPVKVEGMILEIHGRGPVHI